MDETAPPIETDAEVVPEGGTPQLEAPADVESFEAVYNYVNRRFDANDEDHAYFDRMIAGLCISTTLIGLYVLVTRKAR